MQYTQEGRLFTDAVLEVFKVNGLLATEGDRLTKEYGITSARWKVLGAIAMADNPLTVPQIARIMGLTRQAVQRLTDAMQKDALLTYQNNPQHKRAKHVLLTETGKEVYTLIGSKQIPWANQNAAEISNAELQTTLTVLRKMTKLLES